MANVRTAECLLAMTRSDAAPIGDDGGTLTGYSNAVASASPRQHIPRARKPLPLRDGVDPVCFRLPQQLPPEWQSTPAFDLLTQTFDRSVEDLRQQLQDGTIVTDTGHPLTTDTPARPGMGIWSYRPLPASEPDVPLELPRLYEDDTILVVDKPHFLPTIPRGRYVTHTALVQLRRELQETEPRITPAHRLDRHTAGVLLFTKDPLARRAFQMAFSNGTMAKTYYAIAPLPQPERRPGHSPCAELTDAAGGPAHPAALLEGATLDIRSRIVVSRNRLDCYEEPGSPNAHSRVTLLDQKGPYGFYRLAPLTGKTHQLRVHMNSLGIPLVGDPLYPVILEDGPDDPTPLHTLQLLAAHLHCQEPIEGHWGATPTSFHSRRHLQWPDGSAAQPPA